MRRERILPFSEMYRRSCGDVLVVDLVDLLAAEVAVAPPDLRVGAAALAARARAAAAVALVSRGGRHQNGMSSSAAAGAKSAFSRPRPRGHELAAAPPPSRAGRPPRNWTVSAMISTAWRFVPSCASHSRQSRRPSIADGAALGEVLRAALALVAPDGDVEVVRLVGPLARRAVLHARVHGDAELADAVPLGVCRSSGSRVRLPTRTTRLMFAIAPPPPSASAACSVARLGSARPAARRRRVGLALGPARRPCGA